MSFNQIIRKTKFLSKCPDLILVEISERLYDPPSLSQLSYFVGVIVVGLNDICHATL